MDEVDEHRVPTRISAATFRCKATLLQLRRAMLDIATGVRRYPHAEKVDFPNILSESRTPLWNDESLAERELQCGKVHNLRCALRRLDGTHIPAGGLFSFWKQIGQATRRRGYVAGRLLREGCLIPAVGGGLCQLSNALYDVALKANLEIVERYTHSRIVPGSAAAAGRDATVAWNYIDLRFRPHQPILIEAQLTRDELVIRLRGQPARREAGKCGSQGMDTALTIANSQTPTPPNTKSRTLLDIEAHSCATCGQSSCFRHSAIASMRLMASFPQSHVASFGRTAYVVDECWPEFQSYLERAHTGADVLGIPLDGARWRQSRYNWNTSGYYRVVTASWQTLSRSLTTRRLGAYGAARLKAQLDGAADLTRRLARELTADVTRVCVAQSLLPFLWRDGHLGGRHFEVLMTRLPLQVLHARLDAALAAHPDRLTLGEFRAPPWLVAAETEALAEADRVIIPHTDIATLFPGRALRLDWRRPSSTRNTSFHTSSKVIAFPGPTAARKGAYELRSVARVLNLEIILLGSELEGPDFWQDVRTRRLEPGENWMGSVAAVVQPALVEERPHALLLALSAGVPVIATAACGLGDQHGVLTVPFGDEDALGAAIECVILARQTSSALVDNSQCVST